MQDIFNDIDKNKISEYHDYFHKSSSWPEKSMLGNSRMATFGTERHMK